MCASRLPNMVNQPITRFVSRLFHGHSKKSHIHPTTVQRSTTKRVIIVRELLCTQQTPPKSLIVELERAQADIVCFRTSSMEQKPTRSVTRLSRSRRKPSSTFTKFQPIRIPHRGWNQRRNERLTTPKTDLPPSLVSVRKTANLVEMEITDNTFVQVADASVAGVSHSSKCVVWLGAHFFRASEEPEHVGSGLLSVTGSIATGK